MSRIVLAISHSAPGGAQLLWADIAAELARRGHRTSLLALYPEPTQANVADLGLAWSHCLDQAPSSVTHALRAVKSATAYFDREPCDAIFTALPAANVIFPLAARLSRTKPKVFTSHHAPISTYNPMYSALDKLVGATGAVSGVICVSQAVRSSLSGRPRSYKSKARVIRNALPPQVERLAMKLRQRRQKEFRPGGRLIAAGRLAEQKNYPVLLRAMKCLPDATLDIVGSGPDEQALKSLSAELGVADRTRFVGPRPRDEVLELLATRDAFVQPSLFEGHSLALVEAAHVGVPIIVSDVPAQIEGATRGDGTLCAATHGLHDHEALAGAIRRVLDDATYRDHLQDLSQSLGDEIRFSRMVDGYEALV